MLKQTRITDPFFKSPSPERPFCSVAVLFIFLLLANLFLGCRSDHGLTNIKNGENVILLHGLARSSRSLEKLEAHLSSLGYRVFNIDYPSTHYSIAELAFNNLDKVVRECGRSPQNRVHFVTHSMGGIVVRYYLKFNRPLNLGRVVMLCPPNQGTELVDHLKESLFFRKTFGPAAQQLGTKKESLPLELGPVDFELGIITGDRSFYPLNSALIPGPDDGIVSVDRTKVEGMDDFLLLPYSHPFILHKEAVFEQVVHFLKQGAFRHSGEHP